MGKKHFTSEHFDDRKANEFMSALDRGDSESIFRLVSYSGKHENRRARCVALVGEYLKRNGELPLPQIFEDPVQITDRVEM